jgi:hypothetical protein
MIECLVTSSKLPIAFWGNDYGIIFRAPKPDGGWGISGDEITN